MYLIQEIRRNDGSNEVTVICDGERYRITTHDLEAIGIEEGDTLDEDTLALLDESVLRLACIQKAFDYLSYGDLSQKQLRDKLMRKFPRELSESVAELFAERGYINDYELAKRYAETFYEFKNMGLNRIRNELFRRGISRENIEDALAPYELLSQTERIEEFVRKKYDVSRLCEPKYRQKVYAGAIRFGFSGSDVGDFLRNFESE